MSLPVPVVMVLSVAVSSAAVPSKMVARALAEAGAIWREAGVSIEWHGEPGVQTALHVEFGDAAGEAESGQIPVAWIRVLDGVPTNEVHVSRANAMVLLEAARALSKQDEQLPAALNEFVGRALGRALAHEIGHFLFRSGAHDAAGLMATRRASAQLFGPDRKAFLLTAPERQRLRAAAGIQVAAKGSGSMPPLLG